MEALASRKAVTREAFEALMAQLATAGQAEEASSWFQRMIANGFEPGVKSCCAVVDAWAQRDPEKAQEILEQFEAEGRPLDRFAYTSVLGAFADAGNCERAEALLERADSQGHRGDVAAYNALLKGLVRKRDFEPRVERYLQQMRRARLAPTPDWNEITYTTILGASAERGQEAQVEKWLQKMRTARVSPNAVTFEAIIQGLAKHSMEQAEAWLGRMQLQKICPRVTTYNRLLAGAANAQDLPRAKMWFSRMREEQVQPDARRCERHAATAATGDPGGGKLRSWRGGGCVGESFGRDGPELHAYAHDGRQLRLSPETETSLAPAIRPLFSGQRGASSGVAKLAFGPLPDLSGSLSDLPSDVAAGSYVESFNVMLADQAYLADWENALETLEEMKTFSISPDVTSYFACICASRRASAWQSALSLLQEAWNVDLEPTVECYSHTIRACSHHEIASKLRAELKHWGAAPDHVARFHTTPMMKWARELKQYGCAVKSEINWQGGPDGVALEIAARQRELREAGWRIISVEPHVVSTLRNKASMLEYAKEKGIGASTPRCFGTAGEAEYPCILKPELGTFGPSAQTDEYVWPFVKEVRHEYVSVPQAHLDVMRILLSEFSGICCLGYKLRGDGSLCIFEVNPRIGGDLVFECPKPRGGAAAFGRWTTGLAGGLQLSCAELERGAQDTLPYVGQLTGILLEEDEGLFLDSEDLQSAFNLFGVPDTWLPFFAYSKKVDASAFGLPKGKMVRPALSVVPMGWHSAVALVQEAVRNLVFEKAQIPRQFSIEKHKPLPEEKKFTIVYLDNYDEIQVIKRLDMDMSKEGHEISEDHQKFIDACDSAHLPRNIGKQLIHAFAGGLQGGELDGSRGVLKLQAEKLRAYIEASVKLDFKWKQDESMVVIKVCAHHTDAFTTMELPNSASQEEIKKQYKALSLIHHPDKNQDDVEAATERFQRTKDVLIKDAYALIKDTDGELAFPWDQHPEKQQVMKGDEAVAVFAEVGLEACEEHHFQGLQLRHLVKSSEEVKVLKFDKESEGGHITECWLDAICAGSPHFVSHLVKVYRRDAWEYHDAK
eukprot:g18937.t1